jgi:hypothetical protein
VALENARRSTVAGQPQICTAFRFRIRCDCAAENIGCLKKARGRETGALKGGQEITILLGFMMNHVIRKQKTEQDIQDEDSRIYRKRPGL